MDAACWGLLGHLLDVMLGIWLLSPTQFVLGTAVLQLVVLGAGVIPTQIMFGTSVLQLVVLGSAVTQTGFVWGADWPNTCTSVGVQANQTRLTFFWRGVGDNRPDRGVGVKEGCWE